MFNPFFSPGNITEMPPEMILTVVEHMDLESIENLRSTNRQFRAVIDDNNVIQQRIEHMDLESIENLRNTNIRLRAVIDDNIIIQQRIDDMYNQLLIDNRDKIEEMKDYCISEVNIIITDTDALLLLATGYGEDATFGEISSLNYQNTMIALKKGADPNRVRVEDEPYLHSLVRDYSPPKKFLKLLLDYGADPRSENEGRNILHLIVDKYNIYRTRYSAEVVDIVEMFIEEGADVDYINHDPNSSNEGYTPCMVVKDHNPLTSPHRQALIELFEEYGGVCEA